jgi:hypothetical protein
MRRPVILVPWGTTLPPISSKKKKAKTDTHAKARDLGALGHYVAAHFQTSHLDLFAVAAKEIHELHCALVPI